jgi:hypothetical protein
VRRQQRRLRPTELRARLDRLRESCAWLTTRAGLGRQLRLSLESAGSPTWKPCEDLSWRTWIERQGDEYARTFLMAIDEILDERMARIEAERAAAEGS